MLLIHSPSCGDQSLVGVAKALGWDVYSPPKDRWHLPQEICTNRPELAVYGEKHFCWWIARGINRQLLSNSIEWIASLPEEYLKREVKAMSFADACKSKERKFIKSISLKSDFYTGERLKATKVFYEDTRVIVSDPVNVAARYRVIVRNGKPVSVCAFDHQGLISYCARYGPDQGKALSLVASLLRDKRVESVPSVMIDVGRTFDRGHDPSYFILDSKPVWSSRLYGSEKVAALFAVKAACVARN